MEGTVAITDYGWYEFLENQPNLDEVNFWTPSAYWGFRAEVGSPFFFKLKAKYNNAICGVAFFSRYVRLPDWLAWDSFQVKNGTQSLEAMKQKIGAIRKRIDYQNTRSVNEIGCILLTQPVFFKTNLWIKGPKDWPPANLRNKKYNLSDGEGLRIWNECIARIPNTNTQVISESILEVNEPLERYGSPQLIQPRLGQGIFRIAVLEAYNRACAITKEHSLPALDASHIKPFGKDGPNLVSNGLLLRADLHKLFDQGYITLTTDYRVEVSPRLKLDYDNGHSYYPFHGSKISTPDLSQDAPKKDFILWHNENVYLNS